MAIAGLLAGRQALTDLVAEPPVEFGQASGDPGLPLLRAFSRRLRILGFGRFSAGAWPTFAVRAVSQLLAQSGGSPASSFTDPSAHSSMRASTCLHGNFLLGHEHWYAGPATSMTVRYGVAALPRHSPHSAPGSAAPVSCHERPDASDWAARCDGASGARASTRARSQRSATVEP